jgi:hypothetical protein
MLTARKASLSGEEEALLENLPSAEGVRERLAELTGLALDDAGEAWTARVDLDGTTLFLRAAGTVWDVLVAPGADLSVAMSTARRLHGLLGEKGEGWDDDR